MNLETIDDLKPAPYNPRTISPDALHGLRQSVERFGDLSGIVWNARSGHLVAGHQRVKALTDAGATFDPSPPRLVLGDRAFPVRVVDWDDATERAANITANNPHISGEFNDDLAGLLDDLRDFDGFDELRLDLLAVNPYLGEEVNIDEHWQDMPQYGNENESLKLIIQFEDEATRAEFVESMGIRILKKESVAWSTWYPYKESNDLKSLRFDE